MQFLQNLSVLALAFGAIAAATPVEQRDSAPLEQREVSATVYTYSGDNCGNASPSFMITGSGAYRCVPFSGKRSIRVFGTGCRTTTWSGTNCQGSSFVIPDSACHSLLYGSVSVAC